MSSSSGVGQQQSPIVWHRVSTSEGKNELHFKVGNTFLSRVECIKPKMGFDLRSFFSSGLSHDFWLKRQGTHVPFQIPKEVKKETSEVDSTKSSTATKPSFLSFISSISRLFAKVVSKPQESPSEIVYLTKQDKVGADTKVFLANLMNEAFKGKEGDITYDKFRSLLKTVRNLKCDTLIEFDLNGKKFVVYKSGDGNLLLKLANTFKCNGESLDKGPIVIGSDCSAFCGAFIDHFKGRCSDAKKGKLKKALSEEIVKLPKNHYMEIEGIRISKDQNEVVKAQILKAEDKVVKVWEKLSDEDTVITLEEAKITAVQEEEGKKQLTKDTFPGWDYSGSFEKDDK